MLTAIDLAYFDDILTHMHFVRLFASHSIKPNEKNKELTSCACINVSSAPVNGTSFNNCAEILCLLEIFDTLFNEGICCVINGNFMCLVSLTV